MTLGMFLAAMVVGVCVGGLAGLILKRGSHGMLGDLSLGLVGSTLAVLLYETLGVFPDEGTVGAIVAAIAGTVAVVAAQRMVGHRYL